MSDVRMSRFTVRASPYICRTPTGFAFPFVTRSEAPAAAKGKAARPRDRAAGHHFRGRVKSLSVSRLVSMLIFSVRAVGPCAVARGRRRTPLSFAQASPRPTGSQPWAGLATTTTGSARTRARVCLVWARGAEGLGAAAPQDPMNIKKDKNISQKHTPPSPTPAGARSTLLPPTAARPHTFSN